MNHQVSENFSFSTSPALVFTGAEIYDGSGKEAFYGNVYLKSGKITAVTSPDAKIPPEYHIFPADGLTLVPGFIDPHSHSDLSILACPEAFSKISQGVTTELVGNCGLSVFPSPPPVQEHLQQLYAAYNIPIIWQDLDGYAGQVEKAKPAINIGSLCGQNTLRAAVCGYTRKQVNDADILQMKKHLQEAIRQGAFGLSTGLLYVPGIFSSRDELKQILSVLKESQAVYATHLRSESQFLLEAIDEAIELAAAGSGKLQISHLKTARAENWHKITEVLARIESARQNGLQITADRYPYTMSQTSLSVILPEPYASMPDKTIQETLSEDGEKCQALIRHFEQDPVSPDIVLSATGDLRCREFLGQPFIQVARHLNLKPEILLTELMKNHAVSTMGAFGGLSRDNLNVLLRQKWLCCGSDENSRPADFRIGRSHPRAFGSFPRFIQMLRQETGLAEAIRRVTSLPASIFGLHDRGLIRRGFAGDLVLLDPDRFQDHADFIHPHAPASGIHTVCVNGWISFTNGEVKKRAGRFLRYRKFR